MRRSTSVDVALVKAIVAVESGYEPTAVSSKGALGLMQVIPDTAARYGVTDDAKRTIEQKLLDPAINISVGTRYLRDLLALFENDVDARARRVQRGRRGRAALRQPRAAVSRDAGVREARHPVLRAVQAAAAAAEAVAHHRAAALGAAALGKGLVEARRMMPMQRYAPAMEPAVLPPSAVRHDTRPWASPRPTASTARSSAPPARR